VKTRVLVCAPLPHVSEHTPHAPHAPHLQSTNGVPQGLDSLEGPSHGSPQALPAIQPLLLVWVPAPHPTEHAPHAPYGLH
jgi:hypothetical protein